MQLYMLLFVVVEASSCPSQNQENSYVIIWVQNLYLANAIAFEKASVISHSHASMRSSAP